MNDDKTTRSVCPDNAGGTNYWPAAYSPKTKFVYIPELEGCADITPDYSRHVKGKFDGGTYVNPSRISSGIVIFDPASGEMKKRVDFAYPNFAGVLSTAGGLVVTALLDGTVVALATRPSTSCGASIGTDSTPANDLCCGRQAIYRHCIGSVQERQEQTEERAGNEESVDCETMIFVFGL